MKKRKDLEKELDIHRFEEPKKKRRVISNKFLWLILICAAVFFFVTFMRMPMFPAEWDLKVLVGLMLIVVVMGVLSSFAYKNKFIRALDLILIVVFTLCSIVMPKYTDKVSSLFDSLIGNTTTISLYAMNSNYCASHPELYSTDYVAEGLQEYENSRFITFAGDETNQNYALGKLKEQFGHDVETVERGSVIDAAACLYANEGDVLIIPDTMLAMVTDTPEYMYFKDNTIKLGTYTRTVTNHVSLSSLNMTRKPFVIFFGGNDEDGDLYLEGRTDVDMLVTVNPKTAQIALVSMPRDSYIPNPAYGSDAYDKLTHLGLSGIENTMDGLEQYLGLNNKIDNYIVVNFRTYRNIIDALGGVDVENDVEFTAINEMYFPAGSIHLEGEAALMYVRERYAFVNGDFERNYHQQLVMKAIISKLTSPEVIVHFNDLLDSLQGTFMTNISSDSIYALCRKQLKENTHWNIVSYHIEGETGMEYCATVPYDMSSVVYPYDNQVEFVSNIMNAVLSGETVVQEELPQGTYSGE